PRAYATFRELDATTACGKAAHERLDRADALYRRGIEFVEKGNFAAKNQLARAMDLAPMNPALYLPLARACRERGALDRARAFYGKFLQQAPVGSDRDTAQRELISLGEEDPGDRFIPEPPGDDAARPPPPSTDLSKLGWTLGGVSLLALLT